MPLGFDRDLDVTYKGDTAEVYAFVYETISDTPIPESELNTVSFKIVAPDGDSTTKNGEIRGDGTGYTTFTGTDQVGEYKVTATFNFGENIVRSVRSDFEVIDPFDPPTPTDEQIISRATWLRLEDLFDSEEGGPWLSDVTMAYFKKEKMPEFIDQALFDINQQNPPTDYQVGQFIASSTPNADFPLLVQGVMLAVIRHLIRSYVEQPLPTGAQIAWQDRRDYIERWLRIYELEDATYMRWLVLFKRRELGLGHAKTLVSSKAGRLLSPGWRTRAVGRGGGLGW